MSEPSKKARVQPIRWGILSSALIAHDFALSLTHTSGSKIVAVGARKLCDAEAFAKNHNIPNVYGSYAELVKDPEVDVVYIATPHSHHYEHVKLALNAGKHVLCEKAFTINAKQATEIIQLAQEKKLFLMEAMWTRFHPALVKVRDLLAEGAVGEATMFTASFGFAAGAVPRLWEPALAGGAVLDIGVYPISMSSMVFGAAAPSKIVAIGDLSESKVDAQAAISLKYGPKQLASIAVSFLSKSEEQAVIQGTKGRIVIHPPFHVPTKITLIQADHEQSWDFPVPKMEGKFNFFQSNFLYHEAVEVERCLAAGLLESPVMPLAETLTIMKTMDEARAQLGVVYPGEESSEQ